MKADLTTYLTTGQLLGTLEDTRVRKFPLATWDACIRKAKEECDEVLLEGNRSKRLVEYADVLICAVNAARADGFTDHEIVTALLYKTAVNDHRTQTQRKDGSYQHVDLEV